MEMFGGMLDPNEGPMEGGSYGVSGSPGDGPYVEIWAELVDGMLVRATYSTPGCPAALVAGRMLCEICRGRAIAGILLLTPDDLLAVTGGLPEGKGFYAGMAVEAMHRALGQAPAHPS